MYVNENEASLIEIEAGLMKEVLSTSMVMAKMRVSLKEMLDYITQLPYHLNKHIFITIYVARAKT